MSTRETEIKFVLCTTPIRPVPTTFPPVGSTSLLDTLYAEGFKPTFYDIDALRPSFDTVVDYFRKNQPDILGISAVVSTAYKYVKQLAHAVKEVSPRTKIILGGNLAASSEILLKKCPIDVCVIGEGERPIVNLLRYWAKYGDFAPREALKNTKGLSFLDEQGNLLFTGYETPLEKTKLPEPNFDFLAQYSDIHRFITDPMDIPHFARDPRSWEAHRRGQKAATILTSKGCVARCTFCHRWDKGYRAYPVEKIVSTIKYLKEKYNVGFFQIGDENFGSDPRQLKELIAALKPLDILFHVAGVRVFTIFNNPDVISQLREVGCVAMYFGIESGSPKILKVMEKGATVEQNTRVLKKLVEEKMYTIVQLVLGMPGENETTMRETIRFVNEVTEGMDELPFERISANLFQALPGTPGYEYMRKWGMIGNSIDEEEAYLLKISDVDAASREHYQNVSEATMAEAKSWQYRVMREATLNYLKKRNFRFPKETEEIRQGKIKDYARGGYFRILKFKAMRFGFLWRIEFYFHPIFEWGRMLFSRIKCYGVLRGLLEHLHLFPAEFRNKFTIKDSISLRKIVTFPDRETVSLTEANMIPLRLGR